MDVYFAVFNVTEPDLRKARADFNKKFGKGSYVKYIKPYADKGIMSIFKDEPNEKTVYWVNQASWHVCQRLEEVFEPISINK